MLALGHAIPYKAVDIAVQSFRRWAGFREKMELADGLLCLCLIVKSQFSAGCAFYNSWGGGMPEWLKGTGCKPVGYAYVGSNPTPSTTRKALGIGMLGGHVCGTTRKGPKGVRRV